MKALSVGLPGRLNSSFTPFLCAHSSIAFEMNSDPVVYLDDFRQPTGALEPLQHLDHALAGQREIDLDGRTHEGFSYPLPSASEMGAHLTADPPRNPYSNIRSAHLAQAAALVAHSSASFSS